MPHFVRRPFPGIVQTVKIVHSHGDALFNRHDVKTVEIDRIAWRTVHVRDVDPAERAPATVAAECVVGARVAAAAVGDVRLALYPPEIFPSGFHGPETQLAAVAAVALGAG